MILDVDNTLKELLIREMPLKKGEVDITFDQPKREWSSRLSKPTLNLYLVDVQENLELRGSEQWTREENPDGTFTLHRNPVHMNLFYVVTAWTKEVQDEHRLLSNALMALLRQSVLPKELLSETLKQQPLPIRIEVAQTRVFSNPTDFWNVVDNEMRPCVRLTVIVTLDPYKPEIVSAVSASEVKFSQTPSPELAAVAPEKAKEAPSKSYLTVKGKIISEKYSLSSLQVKLVETGENIEIRPDGKFKLSRMLPGEYFLDVILKDRVIKHQKIQVPSATCEIKV